MEKNCDPKRPKRQVTRRKKISADRVDLFVASYVQNKYTIIYKEAVQFYNTLRQKNPEKLDLRKSMSYRAWINDQKQNTIHGQFNNFQLKVHLMNNNDLQAKAKPQSEGVESGVETLETLAEGDVIQPDVEVESVVETFETLAEGEVESIIETFETLAEGEVESIIETVVRETLDESILEPTLEAPISNDLYNEILEGLREDADLANIMADIEKDMLYDDEY